MERKVVAVRLESERRPCRAPRRNAFYGLVLAIGCTSEFMLEGADSPPDGSADAPPSPLQSQDAEPTPPGSGGIASADGSDTVDAQPGAATDSGSGDSARPRDAGPQPDALWVGDLETGDFSQYDESATWNFEGSPVPVWPELVSKTSDPTHVGQGSYASRFELQSGQQRQELILPGGVDFTEGDDLYFGYSLYVDETFNAEPSDWCTAVQWKDYGTGSPPLHAEVRNDGFHFTGGYGHPDGTHPTHDQVVPGGLVRSRWVHFVVHVVFAADPAVGWYEVYMDGVRVLPPFYPPGGTLYPGLDSYHKHGLYCDPSISGSRIVWHDAWRIGESYESVDPMWGL